MTREIINFGPAFDSRHLHKLVCKPEYLVGMQRFRQVEKNRRGERQAYYRVSKPRLLRGFDTEQRKPIIANTSVRAMAMAA